MDTEAILNITIHGMNGDLPDPIMFDATDTEIKTWATEAVRNGNVPGIDAVQDVDFEHFVVERYAPNAERPVPRVMLRPKVPFGGPETLQTSREE